MSMFNKLYSQAPDKPFNPYFYIHYHQEHVGRMGSGLPQSDADMASIFSAYKYNKDKQSEQVNDAVINQYMELVNRQIDRDNKDLTGDVLQIINNTFSTDSGNNKSIEILDTLHEALQQGFEQQFQPNKVQQMLDIASKVKFKQKRKDVQGLIAILNGTADSGQTKAGLSFLDRLLQAMAETVSLARSPKGAALGLELIKLKNSANNINELGTKILKVLKDFENDFNGKTFEADQLQEISGYIKNIGQILSTGKNLKGDKDLNIDMIHGLISKEFFPMTAEVFAADLGEAATNAPINFVLDSLNNIRSGENKTEIQITDTQGQLLGSNFRNSYFNDNSQFSKEQGKADNKFKNVKIDMERIFGKNAGTITMAVGISNKAYVTNYINGQGLKDSNKEYSLGGGISIGQGLDLFLGQRMNIYNKYLAFNIFAHTRDNKGFPEALHSLQDVLLTRGSVYLAGGRTIEDFSQLLLLNGEILPVWDVIKYVLNHNVGHSSYELSKLSDNEKQGVYLSIPNRKNFWNYMTERDGFIRTKETNKIIANAAIHMHIIPKKIIAYAKTSKNLTK